MVNEINGLNPSATGNTSKKEVRVDDASAKNQQSSSAVEQPSGDRFEPSAQARLLNGLEAQIRDLPEVDQEKVETITESINSGQYDIDSFSLAHSIIEFELK